MSAWVAALAAGISVTLFIPPRRRAQARSTGPEPAPPDGWLLRWRLLWAGLAGVAAATLLSGVTGLVAAPVAAVGTWLLATRAEPPGVRRDRDAARRDLPHVVGLLGDALRAGQAPADAVATVVAALPGPAADRLAEVVPRLRLGMDPAEVWRAVGADPSLAPLGHTMARAHVTGASVVGTIDRLASELAAGARADVEDRARAVGVKAAVPLGLCLLPAFVLVGIVPVVAGLLTTLGL